MNTFQIIQYHVFRMLDSAGQLTVVSSLHVELICVFY